MSRIGKKPIALPAGVKVEVQERCVSVTGPRGTLKWSHAPGVRVHCERGASTLTVERVQDTKRCRALHGTTRALIQNMVVGVTEGYRHSLEIYGTGYSCAVNGPVLRLMVGYAHPVDLAIPSGIKVEIEVPATKGNETPAKLHVIGSDRQQVGQFSRQIKDVRPPEPYLGKGIRYAGEQIRRKAGKAFAGAGAGGG